MDGKNKPRDSARIPKILDAIEIYWIENPDLRLGQILNIMMTHNEFKGDFFFFEDDDLLGELQKENSKGL